MGEETKIGNKQLKILHIHFCLCKSGPNNFEGYPIQVGKQIQIQGRSSDSTR